MNNIEERGIRFTVQASYWDVNRSIRQYANESECYVDGLDLYDCVDPDERDHSEGYILSGQAGVLEGMKYPMHRRYTSWNVQVVLTNTDPSRNKECEVLLVAVGDKRLGNNLSIKCSESHRDKIEAYIKNRYYCSRSTRIF